MALRNVWCGHAADIDWQDLSAGQCASFRRSARRPVKNARDLIVGRSPDTAKSACTTR